jgi:hypothetical protein
MPNQDIRLTSTCWPLDAVVDQVVHDARPGGAIGGRSVPPSLP